MLCPEISPKLTVIIERALCKNPDRRYQTAGAMAEALQDLYPLDSRIANRLGRLVEDALGGVVVETTSESETVALGRAAKKI